MTYFDNHVLNELLEKKLFIFDMNGLITDDEGIQVASTNLALKSYDVVVSEKEWKEYVGHKAEETFARIVKKHNLPLDHQELLERKNKHYEEIVREHCPVQPGVLAFLEHLRGRRLCVATGTTQFEAAVILRDCLDIHDLFEFVIDGSMITYGKPDPQIYNNVLARAGVKPESAVVFEDTEVGVRAAKAAGIDVVAVPNDFTKEQDFSGATLVLKSLEKNAVIVER
ncbi:MAG: HAD family phosphatase [Candidatus Woesearchaeota archaeon]|nr:HAD family phosphatase [Candidatus Woesearchaeota archaeon]